MPSFQKRFEESGGKPIVHQGNTIQLYDSITLDRESSIRVRLLSVASKWKQGINIETEGSFVVDGQQIRRSLVLWDDTFPGDVIVKVKSPRGEIIVRNVWDPGDGAMHSWHNGAAMIVDRRCNWRQYRCNDGHPDEDFDDIVFSIEVLDVDNR